MYGTMLPLPDVLLTYTGTTVPLPTSDKQSPANESMYGCHINRCSFERVGQWSSRVGKRDALHILANIAVQYKVPKETCTCAFVQLLSMSATNTVRRERKNSPLRVF
jgi:hypothetical protein